MGSHLDFIDDKKKKREEEIKKALLSVDKKIKSTSPYYDSQIPPNIKEDNPTKEIAINQTNETSSKNNGYDKPIFQTLTVVFGLSTVILGILLIVFFITGVYKQPEMNITSTCMPEVNEGSVNLSCGNMNSTLSCPQINLSQICAPSYNYTYYNQTWINNSNHS